MSLAEFDFALPPERIAQHLARPRDSARLLLIGRAIADHLVYDLPVLLRPGDVLVGNDTKVIPAQLTGRRGDARIGITLDRPAEDGTWIALARNARRLHDGDELAFAAGLSASVAARAPDGSVRLRFNLEGAKFAAALHAAGALALPPYIDRPHGPSPEDTRDYQTMFARHEGAVAAPTAGLHFTPALIEALTKAGIRLVTITLHVGAGTFLPVREEEVSRHHMHPERGYISRETAETINARSGRVVAIGTTSLRLIESAADDSGRLESFSGETDLFIRPGYRFRIADVLITNFHLPRSTLFMLVCAFAGTDRMHAAYEHAIQQEYRFYSYGDACLIERPA